MPNIVQWLYTSKINKALSCSYQSVYMGFGGFQPNTLIPRISTSERMYPNVDMAMHGCQIVPKLISTKIICKVSCYWNVYMGFPLKHIDHLISMSRLMSLNVNNMNRHGCQTIPKLTGTNGYHWDYRCLIVLTLNVYIWQLNWHV